MMCIHIEVATAADVEAILAVQRAAYELKETPLYGPDLPPLREAPAMLTDELLAGVVILKAMEEGRIVGSLRIVREDDTARFGRISVAPDRMGRGIGSALIAAAERMTTAWATRYAMWTGVESRDNLRLYRRLGYRETEERKQIPGGPLVVNLEKRPT